MKEEVQMIDILIKALGTMVLEPQFDRDPVNIAAKPVFTGTVQRPILEGISRDKALSKLSELIDKL